MGEPHGTLVVAVGATSTISGIGLDKQVEQHARLFHPGSSTTHQTGFADLGRSRSGQSDRHFRAKRLGVSRLSVSELLLEKRSLTADMAMRIATLTNTSPESWLRMQEALDLWGLAQDSKKYRAIEPLAA